MKPNDRGPAANELLHGNEFDFLTALKSCQSVHSVAQSTGLSSRIVEGVLKSVCIILHANDAAVDDFLTLVENWSAAGLEGFVFPDHVPPKTALAEDYLVVSGRDGSGRSTGQQDNLHQKKQAIIEAIERDWSPQEMRDLGASMIRLADALDQDWNAELAQFSFHWPSAARQIERSALELAKKATLIKRQLVIRKKYLPDASLGEPTWNMLLELFCQFAGGASVSTKSLCIAAECPESTALRHIDRLEEAGLIRRFHSRTDRRVTLAELTKRGVVGVGRVLERISI
jgi:DNA-binding MarR family transcriptional regulator